MIENVKMSIIGTDDKLSFILKQNNQNYIYSMTDYSITNISVENDTIDINVGLLGKEKIATGKQKITIVMETNKSTVVERTDEQIEKLKRNIKTSSDIFNEMNKKYKRALEI